MSASESEESREDQKNHALVTEEKCEDHPIMEGEALVTLRTLSAQLKEEESTEQ